MQRPVIILALLALLIDCAEATAACNAWGWWYNNGAALPKERRINIVARMLLTNGNVVATAAFVKCTTKTVRKWWRTWQQTGEVEVQRSRCGPAAALSASALLPEK